ncbi:LuxR C-terminal-related transcriptional regulator [Streptomyces prunicolor]|uniref:helix-turn-helix transcriptional regulator n=1 Tax=Streptomyces prunicolor TaxID=67348 RepID=UPI00224E1A6D|nr:LuxR C-terminal-related transcriptional regulator [Streptomyces prunicolor]MCX5240449.1 LuxR C-terminal-related transcriptional regulator [Streptomyces prunicolor]
MTTRPTSVAEDSRLIGRALAELRDATGLGLAFGGVVTAEGQVRLDEFAGVTKGALRGVGLAFGQGLGGKVVALRRPMAVNDYVASERISHHYDRVITAEGLRAMVAVPVVVCRTVRGVLYGAVRQVVPLGDRAVQAVADAARDLEQELAVRDEVARRLAWLSERAAEPAPGPMTPQWELVREAYADLRSLARQLTDSEARQQFDVACEKLAAAGHQTLGVPGEPVLSPRELDVLACVAVGRSNADAAIELGIGVETVKSYLRSATRKLGSRSRLEAVVAARRLGLLP